MEGSTFLIGRGVLSLLFGIVALVWPGITLAALTVLFGVYAFLDGAVHLVLWFSPGRAHTRSWTQLALGLLGIAAGVVTVLWPGLTLLVLVMYIAAWAVLRGVFDLVAAVRLRKVITGEWLLVLSGLLSLFFGFLVFTFPAAGALTIAWLLGAYAVAAGIVLIALGIRIRRPAVA
jgi:uncharacterized membrane protein HdeD (DUF308 family)